MPEFGPDNRISHIGLPSNCIQHLNHDYVRKLTKLVYLNLNRNSLQSFSQELTSTNAIITLLYNPLDCTDLPWLSVDMLVKTVFVSGKDLYNHKSVVKLHSQMNITSPKIFLSQNPCKMDVQIELIAKH